MTPDPAINALLAVLMDTPGLKQQEIVPMLERLQTVIYDSKLETFCIGLVLTDMIKAME